MLSSKITDEERFADATKFDVRCFRCGSARVFGGLQDDLVSLPVYVSEATTC